MFSPRETHLHTPQYKTQLAEEGWEKDNKHHLFLKEMGLKERGFSFVVDVGCTKAEVFQREARASKWPRDLLGRLGGNPIST